MFIGYCKTCLPTKVVLGWGTTKSGVHEILHSVCSSPQTGAFELSDLEWTSVFVPDNPDQTITNIATSFGDRFVDSGDIFKPLRKPESNFHVQTMSENTLQKEEWFEVDEGGGIYSKKSREIVYIYTDGTSILTRSVERAFWDDESLVSVTTLDYYTDPDTGKTIVKKVIS